LKYFDSYKYNASSSYQVIKMSDDEQEQEFQREVVCVSGVIFYRDTENNLFYKKRDKNSVGKWHQDPYQIEWVYSDDEE
jgi:hypothetical protein